MSPLTQHIILATVMFLAIWPCVYVSATTEDEIGSRMMMLFAGFCFAMAISIAMDITASFTSGPSRPYGHTVLCPK
jgi:hypothetical protein